MDHLLTLAADEFDRGTWRRWCPKEDAEKWDGHDGRAISSPAFEKLGDGSQYIFLCRTCKGWPIESVFQCT
jgi:hypothetical protein